ncbi:MAG: SWIM zinc finger family protein [Chloroflexi bacterium]|nr:SWIM zinc finger family protein [Chloroflexota bacterium]
MEPRQPSKGVRISVAGVLALTDPGPAAAGFLITGPTGRVLHRRAYYLGQATADVASVRALIAALRFAVQRRFDHPVVSVERLALADLLGGAETAPATFQPFRQTVAELAQAIPGLRVRVVAPETNPARAVALGPLLEWLPARTRRADRITIQTLAPGVYEVASAHVPGQTYLVWLPKPGTPGRIACTCPDYQYRGLPCKHLLAVAGRSAGGRQRLFYPTPGETAMPPSGAVETHEVSGP